MPRFLQILGLALLIALPAHAQTYSYNGVSPKLVIDVRTPDEFASGHVEGAVNIPYDQIGTSNTLQSAPFKNLKKEDPVLVYCRSGRRSAIAKQELSKLGYQTVMDGGGLETLSARLKSCKSVSC